MKYTIAFTTPAVRALKKLGLSRAQKELLLRAIDSLAEDPFRGYPLRKALKGFYKLRVGDYRIVYDIRQKKITVVVIAVGHRKDVYDTLTCRLR